MYTNPEARGLVSFLLGIVSHGVADAPWHSLDMGGGFIEALLKLQFEHDFDDAHKSADAGGEFVLAHSSSLSYLSPVWKIPTGDLVEIYEMLNFSVTTFQINSCMLQGYAAAQGNRIVGRYLFSHWAQEAPFLVDQYYDYFRGGINDISKWITNCWHATIEWLEHGPITPMCRSMDRFYLERPGPVHPPPIVTPKPDKPSVPGDGDDDDDRDDNAVAVKEDVVRFQEVGVRDGVVLAMKKVGEERKRRVESGGKRDWVGLLKTLGVAIEEVWDGDRVELTLGVSGKVNNVKKNVGRLRKLLKRDGGAEKVRLESDGARPEGVVSRTKDGLSAAKMMVSLLREGLFDEMVQDGFESWVNSTSMSMDSGVDSESEKMATDVKLNQKAIQPTRTQSTTTAKTTTTTTTSTPIGAKF
ncbi:integrin subunit alpha 8, partial [Blyttiomyces sp. JEL0837]